MRFSAQLQHVPAPVYTVFGIYTFNAEFLAAVRLKNKTKQVYLYRSISKIQDNILNWNIFSDLASAPKRQIKSITTE
jgi:hypothetical protein